MRWRSFRVRLTLWNIAVLALALGGFGLVLHYSLQSRAAAAIDRALAARARRFTSERFRPPPGPPFPGRRGFPGPPPGSMGPPPQGSPPPRPRHMGWPGEESEGTQSWPVDSDTRRLALIRRPRLLDPQGQVLGPPDISGPWDLDTLRESAAGLERYSTILVDGERVRVFSAPWYRNRQITGVIQVAEDLREYDRQGSRQVLALLTLLPLSLLVAGLGGLFLSSRALRPVIQVTRTASEIGEGDLSRRIEVIGDDELAELAATFNAMIARLEAAFNSREEAYTHLQTAFEQQKRFTADASHELRTPLTRIKVSTSMALSGEESVEEYRTALQVADRAADVMGRLIQQLLILARADAGQLDLHLTRLEMASILEEAAASLPRPDGPPIRLDLPSEPLEIEGDPDHLIRVFLNLLENAARHTPSDGQVTVSACPEKDTVKVCVADTGEGIPPEHLPHIFERFYRVDAARSRASGGSGLGLAICQSIIQAHQGNITIESQVNQGTVVTVTLPQVAPLCKEGI